MSVKGVVKEDRMGKGKKGLAETDPGVVALHGV